MSYPFADCPTVWDLLSQASGTLSFRNRLLDRRVRAHASSCTQCQRALHQLGSSATDLVPDGASNAEVERLFAAIRGSGAADPRRYEAGAVWTIDSPGGDSENFYRDNLLVALVRAPNQDKVSVAVPVTTNTELAAEWSLVLPLGTSGFSASLVAHVDRQFGIHQSQLRSYLCPLDEAATQEIVKHSLEVWGGRAPSRPVIGHFGSFAVRERVEWLHQSAMVRTAIDRCGVFGEPSAATSVAASEVAVATGSAIVGSVRESAMALLREQFDIAVSAADLVWRGLSAHEALNFALQPSLAASSSSLEYVDLSLAELLDQVPEWTGDILRIEKYDAATFAIRLPHATRDDKASARLFVTLATSSGRIAVAEHENGSTGVLLSDLRADWSEIQVGVAVLGG